MARTWPVDDLGSRLTPPSAMAGAWSVDDFRNRLKGGSVRATWGETRDRGDRRRENEELGARFVDRIERLFSVSATSLPAIAIGNR